MTKKLIETAQQRSNIYGLLSLILSAEISKQLLSELRSPAFLTILSEMGAELEDDFLKNPEKKLAAWENKDDKGVQCFLEVEKLFFERHLISWVPDLCDKIMEMAEHYFYREMARVTNHFMEFEREEEAAAVSMPSTGCDLYHSITA